MDTEKPSRLVPALLLLTVVTGLVDAISVLALGKVFIANMTGNVVFIGFALVGTPGFDLVALLLALAAFLLGAYCGGRLSGFRNLNPSALPGQIFVEAVLLAAAAALAVDFDPATLAPRWRLFGVITTIGLAMGCRNAIVRKLKVTDLTTTVLTLTLTGLAADREKSGVARRLSSVAALCVGAGCGAFLLSTIGLVWLLILATALTGLAAWLCN